MHSAAGQVAFVQQRSSAVEAVATYASVVEGLSRDLPVPCRKPVLTQQRSFEAFWHNQVPCRRDADGHGAERISAELRDVASSAGLCRTTAIQGRRRLFNLSITHNFQQRCLIKS